jgi:hypothetical protein
VQCLPGRASQRPLFGRPPKSHSEPTGTCDREILSDCPLCGEAGPYVLRSLHAFVFLVPAIFVFSRSH